MDARGPAGRVLATLRARWRVPAFFASLALGVRLAAPAPPEPTEAGLAAFLGAELRGAVRAEDIAWEPKGGMLGELFRGRPLVFLASAADGAPRDLYRAWVRLAPGGQPLAVTHVFNLTDTPVADEAGLIVQGQHAVFASVARGRVQAVSVLDLDGTRPEDRSPSRLGRALGAISARSATGAFGGIGRTDLFFEKPVAELALARSQHALSLRLPTPGEEARFDLERHGLTGDAASDVRVVRRLDTAKTFALWLSDAARELLGSELGELPASAWSAARDLLARARYAFVAPPEHRLRHPVGPASTPGPAAQVVAARDARGLDQAWPPPRVPTLWEKRFVGEGDWSAVPKPFRAPDFRATSPAREAYFQRTLVRPDPRRPHARVLLVAMDMRLLELGLESGTELPRSALGPPGEGRLPKEAGSATRVVAVFGGGRVLPDARYGMQIGGRSLVSAKEARATVATTTLGESLLGASPWNEAVPEHVVSFRQGLVPLLDEKGRVRGEIESAASGVERRSGLCATRAGQLYYAFGESLDLAALARTFALAGCGYAVALARGSEPTGMALADVKSRSQADFSLLDPAMNFDAGALVRGSSRDFFYLALRDLRPSEPASATWAADAGAQPLPTWLTGIFRARVPLGSLSVELVAFEAGRVEWRLRPGVREPGARGEPWAGHLDEADAERALGVLELGHTTVTPRLGLVLGATVAITLKSAFSTLVLSPTEPPRILRPGESVELGTEDQAAQLPLLADENGVTEQARERGDVRDRAALGVTRAGRVVVALLRHDSSDPLAVALRDAGCERVVELDRGSHHPAFVARAGTPTPPGRDYESTTLWAVARPMIPSARIGLK